MIQWTKKILTFSFALYFLGVSLGTTLNLHYCGGEVVGFSLFNQVADCGMHTQNQANTACEMRACHSSKGAERLFALPQQADCCSDRSIYLYLDTQAFVVNPNVSIDISHIETAKEANIHSEICQQTSLNERFIDSNQLNSYPPSFILFQQLMVYA